MSEDSSDRLCLELEGFSHQINEEITHSTY